MNKRQRERYRKQLLAKREELLQLVQAARKSEKEGTFKQAPDLGDRALSTVIRDLSYQLTVTERDILRRVDDALDRIENNEYGMCVACGKKVPRCRSLGPPLHRMSGIAGSWRDLTRISHHVATTARDMPQSAAFSPIGVLDVLSSTPPRPSGRERHISRHLADLATRRGEIWGLGA